MARERDGAKEALQGCLNEESTAIDKIVEYYIDRPS